MSYCSLDGLQSMVFGLYYASCHTISSSSSSQYNGIVRNNATAQRSVELLVWPQSPRMKATASRPFSSSSLCRCCRSDSLVMVVVLVVCLLKELFRLFSGLQIPSCCLRLLNQLRVILKGNSNNAAAAASIPTTTGNL